MSSDDRKPPETDDDGWGQAADLERSLSDMKEAEASPDRAAPVDPLAERVDDSKRRAESDAEGDASDPQLLQPDPPPTRKSEVDDDRGPTASSDDSDDPEDAEWGDDLTPVPRAIESPAEAAGIGGRRPPPGGGKGGRGSPRGRSRTPLLILAGLLLLGVGGLLSWWNHQHFYYVCGTKSIRAERGSLWPWGQSSLDGAAYRPISIPPDVECESLEIEDRREFEDAFLEALLERASSLLLSGDPEAVVEAEAQLQQALLIARDPERRDQRKRIERLLGDVEYWRAAAEVKSAIETLENAARRFDHAAARRPRHNSDASIWGSHARRQADELRRGPIEQRNATSTPPEEPHFSGTGAADEEDGAQAPDSAPEPPTVLEPSAPDAGLPRGGVLL